MIKHLIICYLCLAQIAIVQENSISCFVYHRFGDDRYPSTNITLPQFETHLKYLQETDYQTLTLSEALSLMERKNKFPKAAVLTIDDDFSSVYQNAPPLLKKYGFTAAASLIKIDSR